MAHKLSEYIKFDKIVVIQVLGSWEDFQQFDLYENKLRNCLTTRLVACVQTFK